MARHNIPVSDFEFLANSSFGKSKNLPKANDLNKIFKRELFIIAGDGGNSKNLPRLFCSKKGKITYIINGLGGLKNDALLIINNNKIYKYNL